MAPRIHKIRLNAGGTPGARLAVIISLTSLLIAAFSSAFAFFQYTLARDQLLAGARPHLVIERQMRLVAPKIPEGPENRLNLLSPHAADEVLVGELVYQVRNIGTGRAVLKWAGAGFGGNQIDLYTEEILSECGKQNDCKKVLIGHFIGLGEGRGAAPGESFVLFYLQVRLDDMIAADSLMKKFDNLQYRFVYCSIYGECFQTCTGFAPDSVMPLECNNGQISTVGMFDRLNPIFEYDWGQEQKSK
jgi:hypothetical protein